MKLCDKCLVLSRDNTTTYREHTKDNIADYKREYRQQHEEELN